MKKIVQTKALVSLSGGMDSTTVLTAAFRQAQITGGEVQAVSFCYGSKHNPYENLAAVQIAKHYGIQHELIDLSQVGALLNSNLLRSGGPIPEGHYQADNMSQTVVPGRNLIFISILTGLAWSRGLNSIWLGIHQGDHVIYPDCRIEFFDAMNSAVMHGTDHAVSLEAPFLRGDKTTIIEFGRANDTPYHLTRTCYKDQPIACGRCGACQERLEAFRNNGIEDPIEYEAREALAR